MARAFSECRETPRESRGVSRGFARGFEERELPRSLLVETRGSVVPILKGACFALPTERMNRAPRVFRVT